MRGIIGIGDEIVGFLDAKRFQQADHFVEQGNLFELPEIVDGGIVTEQFDFARRPENWNDFATFCLNGMQDIKRKGLAYRLVVFCLGGK